MYVQIVPLWNWNIGQGHGKIKFTADVQIVPLWNWNAIAPAAISERLKVQIVPLWNWNTIKIGKRQTAH